MTILPISHHTNPQFLRCQISADGYALSLGLVYWLGAEVRELMREHDYDLAKSQGNDSWFVPVPATFVVDKNGRVAACHVDPDYRKRIEVDALLEALKAAAD